MSLSTSMIGLLELSGGIAQLRHTPDDVERRTVNAVRDLVAGRRART